MVSETREVNTVKKMIAIYCRHFHGQSPCSDCNELFNYTQKRIERCPQLDNKPTCSDCTIHCYQEVMRERISEIMRFSGPKMIYRHPYLAIMHVIDHFLFLLRQKKEKKTSTY